MAVAEVGLVVPGRPMEYNFQVLSEDKAVCALQYPASIHEITFFLLPSSPALPPGHGAVVYYSSPPTDGQLQGVAGSGTTEWQVLGAIHAE